MKIAGIILLCFAVLNLVLGLFTSTQGAPADYVGQRFNGAILFGVVGGLLYYFGKKKKDKNKEENNEEEK